MKNIKLIIAVTIIATYSLASLAAEQIQKTDNSLEQIAVISTFGASTPDELTQKLSKKADDMGASKFKVIMTSGNDNSERGTAIVYR